MATEKRRHHYVSEFFCKKFSEDGKFLYRYDNEKKEIIRVSTKDAFVQRDLNTLKINGNTDPNFVEDYMANSIEGPASEAIRNLLYDIESGDVWNKFTLINRVNILKFIILSHLRTPASIEKSATMFRKGAYIMTNIEMHNNGEDILEHKYAFRYNESFIRLQIFMAIEKIIKESWDFSFYVLRNLDDKFPFLLSDQPVVLITEEGNEFASKDLVIMVPLSSNYVLVLDRQFDKEGIVDIPSADIDAINETLIRNSYRYIACSNKGYLESFVGNRSISFQSLPLQDFTSEEHSEMVKKILATEGQKRYIYMSKQTVLLLTETELKRVQKEHFNPFRWISTVFNRFFSK